MVREPMPPWMGMRSYITATGKTVKVQPACRLTKATESAALAYQFQDLSKRVRVDSKAADVLVQE